MATILEQIKNLEKLSEAEITKQLFIAVKKAENKFIALNKSQLLRGENQQGKVVGEYSPYTEGFADRDGVLTDKTPNAPYNFQWTGDFYKGFSLTVSGEEATIFSTGIGTGGKADFLTTNNLLGLMTRIYQRLSKMKYCHLYIILQEQH